MKTVEFKLAENSVFEYWCSCCGDSAEIDHSGTYVLASDAEAEIAKAIRLLRILLSVKITDSDGNVALGISETKYQEARAFLNSKEA